MVNFYKFEGFGTTNLKLQVIPSVIAAVFRMFNSFIYVFISIDAEVLWGTKNSFNGMEPFLNVHGFIEMAARMLWRLSH